MRYSLDDTIAGIATALGEAGIGIIRISGPESRHVLRRLFRPTGWPGDWEPESHRLVYGHIVDPESGETVDEAMAVWMRAPRSYTRQDVVEFHCHGGSTVLRAVLTLVLASGVRLAEPGEMTLRAFLNGRVDLAQAEAVLDVVRARTEAGLRAAQAQLAGALSAEIREARSSLLEVLAHLSALIDFPEDDVPPQMIGPQLESAARLLEDLLSTADRGILLREGLRIAIVGRPNVGKSSLLNRLLRQERAIVTDIPGTTRDLLEESLSIRGVPVVLADTAGIRETSDVVEALGVARSRAALEQADLVLLVVDASSPLTEEDRALAEIVADRPLIVVWNKLDLLPNGPEQIDGALLPEAPRVMVSARTGEGIETLEARVWELVMGGEVVAATGREALVNHPRHKAAIRQALESVRSAQAGLAEGLPADLLTIDLTAAVNALGEITGETATEDLLDVIFSRFCIGK